ncbi:uncharacterized protein LOC127864089 [Dreissena polymorpha]|uniref:Exonuclease domain-containing protein n=1 Tax=Dreissena polymorpha TaxID=45954 RepID=A0A9D3XY12_DREPO|nr:uncharacterized protein LOC127864089 [Dreissena polymorpha]KAH3689406.1 hypothetical protein DPMN_193543 [Dreissena polymorpha]
MAVTGDATVLVSGETTLMDSEDTIPKIATYVFFDLESTDLLHARTRITELCLFAVNRFDMQAAGMFPRVTNKLTLCFDPLKPISASSSSITGLYNDSLESQKPFTASTVQLLQNFLGHLQPPVCLLAHYGNGFDFPLLKQELQRINQSLDSSILCADTLEAFRSLDGVEPGHELPLCLCAMCSELRDSHNYTPVRNHTIPPTPQTPIKRKLDKESDDTTNLKKLHQYKETNGCGIVRQGAAVKKRLDFQASESHNDIHQKTSNNAESDTTNTGACSVKKRLFVDSNQAVCIENLEEQDEDVNSEFSASQDLVCLEALEEIENTLTGDIEDISESKDPMISEDQVSKSSDYINHKDQNSKSTDSAQQANNRDIMESKSSVIPNDPVSSSTGYLMKSKGEVLDSTGTRSTSVDKRSPVKSCHPLDTIFTTPRVFNAPAASTGQKLTETDLKQSTDIKLSTDVRSKCLTPIEQNISSSNLADDKSSFCKSSISSASDSTLQTVNGSHADINNSCASISAELVTCDSHMMNVDNTSPKTSCNSNPLLSACGESGAKNNSSPANNNSSPANNNSSPANNNSTPANNNSSRANNYSVPKRHSYKLEEIHKRVLGEKPTRSHYAEDDCVAMVKIAKCTRGFMEWVDRHARPLSSI